MTSTVEYTYLYDGFSLSINEGIMNRAVRVKTAVKDKIKRIFNSKEVELSSNVTSSAFVEDTQVIEPLYELSQEKLMDLNNQINGLGQQKNVSYSTNRAVLFTQPLVAKIRRVSNKWFDGMPVVEKNTVDIPSVNMINHLGGEVVPGNWNSVQEKEEAPVSVEPTLEAVPTVTEPAFPVEEAQTNTDVPVVPAEQEMPTVNIEIPTVSENTDIYRFPSFEFNMESVAPLSQNTSVAEEEVPAFDFVPEPKEVDAINKNDFVKEPSTVVESNVETSTQENDFAFEMPSFEPTVSIPTEVETPVVVEPRVSVNVPETSVMEKKIGELLSREFKPASKFVRDESMVDDRTAEDKIDELLNRKVVVEENKELAVPEVVVNEVKPELTQAHVLARLRRVNNTMAEKDAAIKSLTAKNEALREENAVGKERLAEYEFRVSELNAKNSELLSQNERLTARVDEAESVSKSTIVRLEAKVNELTQSKNEEIEELKRKIEELTGKYNAEISSMKMKHAAELKSVSDSKEKQIQAIYATITEALGDSTLEDDYTRGMAA